MLCTKIKDFWHVKMLCIFCARKTLFLFVSQKSGISVIFAMVRCSHSCDFTLNLVHFWIEVRISFHRKSVGFLSVLKNFQFLTFSHSNHLMLKVVACIVRVSRSSGTSLKLLGVSRPLKEGKV